jgi:hypothetical protein
MQFQVPQFIDTEDKIVGPFSLKQFAYVGAAGIVSAIFYFFAQTWLWAIISIIVFGIALSLAFVKIEGRDFASIIVSAFNFYWKPQTYVWQPEHPSMASHPSEEKIKTGAGASALEEILAKSAAKTRSAIKNTTSRAATVFSPRSQAPAEPKPISRETVSAGSALHRSWEDVQTGASFAKKNSDKQFLEQKMMERYQIFRREAGDRRAAKRVDYR